MNSKSFAFFAVLSVLGTLMQRTQGLRQQSPDPITDALNRYGYENIGSGKYAVVVNGYGTWHGALDACKSYLPGSSLFTVDNPQDSTWLGKKINFEKDSVTGASKFWVGLISQSVNGPLNWLSGLPHYNYPEVVQVSGYDDETKEFAWAVPDGSHTKLKYEFLTADDEAEAYICQYI